VLFVPVHRRRADRGAQPDVADVQPCYAAERLHTVYTPNEVGRLRNAPFEDTAAVRAQLLEAIGDQEH
jgi:hypothetical protein